ncbi:MAG TPA: ATP-binding protein [Actinomycetota bacterium]|nr:ATP-binding protein [Actinomycetota bacterium]
MGQLALAGLVVAVALGVVGVYASRRAAENQAIREASRLTEVLGESVVMPNLSDSLLSSDPEAVRRLDTVVVGRLTDRSLVRVKLWTRDGRVVYSDEHRLIGVRFSLQADELRAFHDNRPHADISDLSAPENQFERGQQGPLLEVYLPIRTPDGSALLLETYSRYSSVTANAGEIWREFVPITLGALLLLQLVQLPLAWSTSRRLDSSLLERERLLRRAVEATDAERLRIARDLHDGVVQDLAAASYSLVGAGKRAASAGHDQEAEALELGADALRRGIRSLRTLLVELYPPSLHRTGLGEALRDLLDPLAGRGIKVDLQADGAATVSGETAELVFRVAQEAVRNIAEHAAAKSVDMRLESTDGTVQLTVADDGVGFDTARLRGRPAEGHVGLLLLRDLVQTAGGTLGIESTPGQGTCLRLGAPTT